MAVREEVLTVEATELGCRIDAYLVSCFQGLSRSASQRSIRAGQVRINGAPCKPKSMVRSGDLVAVEPDFWPSRDVLLRPVDLPLQILFEDQDILVVDKPVGLVAHPGAGTQEPTLADGIAYYLREDPKYQKFCSHILNSSGEQIFSQENSGIVHRLDKDTSGVVVVAKDPEAKKSLAKQFRQRTNLREYWALFPGDCGEGSISVNTGIRRHPGNRSKFQAFSISSEDDLPRGSRLAKSRFTKIRHYGNGCYLVKAQLDTGRTHQIRVHAAFLRLPVIGDCLYGSHIRKIGPHKISRQMLHARTLGFCHPRTSQKLAFSSPLPDDFASVIDFLESKNVAK